MYGVVFQLKKKCFLSKSAYKTNQACTEVLVEVCLHPSVDSCPGDSFSKARLGQL